MSQPNVADPDELTRNISPAEPVDDVAPLDDLVSNDNEPLTPQPQADPGTAVHVPPKPLPGMPDFRFFEYDELEAITEMPHLVEGLVDAGKLIVLYGPSGSYKTFFVLALALAIANGIPFGVRATTQGLVCYIAAEGGKKATHRRRVAFDERYGGKRDADFRVIFSAVTLTDRRQLQHLITLIRYEEARLGRKFALIVVDTLAR